VKGVIRTIGDKGEKGNLLQQFVVTLCQQLACRDMLGLLVRARKPRLQRHFIGGKIAVNAYVITYSRRQRLLGNLPCKNLLFESARRHEAINKTSLRLTVPIRYTIRYAFC
jgi:hypothetical protein